VQRKYQKGGRYPFAAFGTANVRWLEAANAKTPSGKEPGRCLYTSWGEGVRSALTGREKVGRSASMIERGRVLDLEGGTCF
jgi:hypothetical protein